ncbi:hypothetical protein ACWC5C_38650 [Streptomyces sp. NPDC001700]
MPSLRLIWGKEAPPHQLDHGQLIEQLAGVDIAVLHDECGAALDQVVEAKLQGLFWGEPFEPEPAVDLMKALEDTIHRTQRGGPYLAFARTVGVSWAGGPGRGRPCRLRCPAGRARAAPGRA